jgi:hypothetical protein
VTLAVRLFEPDHRLGFGGGADLMGAFLITFASARSSSRRAGVRPPCSGPERGDHVRKQLAGPPRWRSRRGARMSAGPWPGLFELVCHLE